MARWVFADSSKIICLLSDHGLMSGECGEHGTSELAWSQTIQKGLFKDYQDNSVFRPTAWSSSGLTRIALYFVF
jgi:hypothetical protein